MTNHKWHLYCLEEPEEDGVYEVRLKNKYSYLDAYVEALMEFKDGEWITKVVRFINEYEVYAWRHR